MNDVLNYFGQHLGMTPQNWLIFAIAVCVGGLLGIADARVSRGESLVPRMPKHPFQRIRCVFGKHDRTPSSMADFGYDGDFSWVSPGDLGWRCTVCGEMGTYADQAAMKRALTMYRSYSRRLAKGE